MTIEAVIGAVGRYAMFFAWLAAAGFGIPPGEDILLAGTGVLVGDGMLSWWPVIVLGVVAVVASDNLLFLIGRRASPALPRRMPIPARVRRWVEAVVDRWRRPAVALARFVPGARAITYVSVGMRGMSYREFLLIDAIAASCWVPLVATIGAAVVEAVVGPRMRVIAAWWPGS